MERTIEDEKYGTVHTSILPLQGTLAEPPRPRNDDDDDDSEEWVEKAIDYFEVRVFDVQRTSALYCCCHIPCLVVYQEALVFFYHTLQYH